LLAKAKFIDAATRIASGATGFIVGLRELVHLGHGAGLDVTDEDFRYLMGVESESDALPIGSERAYWDAEALKRKADEIREFEASYRDEVMETISRLRRRFEEAQDSN
jgi:hypothetical protein